MDELIDKSWNEILACSAARAETTRGEIGLKEIERLLGEALKSGSFVLPASTFAAPPQRAAADVPTAAEKPREQRRS